MLSPSGSHTGTSPRMSLQFRMHSAFTVRATCGRIATSMLLRLGERKVRPPRSGKSIALALIAALEDGPDLLVPLFDQFENALGAAVQSPVVELDH